MTNTSWAQWWLDSGEVQGVQEQVCKMALGLPCKPVDPITFTQEQQVLYIRFKEMKNVATDLDRSFANNGLYRGSAGA